MKSFEDFDFACLDNVPPVLATAYVDLVAASGRASAAVALDVRSGGSFGDALTTLDGLERSGHAPEVLFLDADDATLVRRYSETRRRHPFGDGSGGLQHAIERERAALAALRERADVVWDTTTFTHATLKEHIAAAFVTDSARHTRIVVLAFGYKYGVPLDADWVFDVRFLPNPHYVPELKALTGNDPAVQAYLGAVPDLAAFVERMNALVDFVVPRARAEGKSLLTFAIGCTGGRHRSIYLGRLLAEHLAAGGNDVTIEERDITR
jgi:UPF0042 nucleotide-binding protein